MKFIVWCPRCALGFIVGALIAQPAWAAQVGESYLGLGLGQSRFPQMASLAQFWPDVSSVQTDATPMAWKFYTGYQFSHWLAVETAWVDFGDTRVKTVSGAGDPAELLLSTAGFEFTGLATWSVTGQTQVFLRAGALAWKGSGHLRLADGLVAADFATPDNDGFAAVMGVGAQWDFSQRSALRLEWEKYVDVAGGDPETWLLSAVRRF